MSLPLVRVSRDGVLIVTSLFIMPLIAALEYARLAGRGQMFLPHLLMLMLLRNVRIEVHVIARLERAVVSMVSLVLLVTGYYFVHPIDIFGMSPSLIFYLRFVTT